MRARRLLALVAAAVLALHAPGAAALEQQAQPESNDLTATIVDFNFQPQALTVKAGDKVVWTNTGKRPHTVTDRGGAFDTDPIAPNTDGSVTFSVPGTYNYFCRINPGTMNGTIVVEPGAGAAPAQRVQTIGPAPEGGGLRFDPAELTVEAGSALVVANVGGAKHTLTADDGSFDTGVIEPGPEKGKFAGSNKSLRLDTPGRFPFHCEIHPAAMKGVLTVTGEAVERGGAPPPAAAEAPAEAAAPAPAEAEIGIADFEFSPLEQSVAPGASLTWTNNGDATHTATFDTKPVDTGIDTGNIGPGQSATATAPTEPGSYSYYCNIHPDRMRGVLVVLPEGVPDPTKKVEAPPAGAEAAPAAPPAGGGPGGGGLTIALITAVVGAFLGGIGLSGFMRRRKQGESEGGE